MTNLGREADRARPRLSIIIPCRNGAAELGRCLAALAEFPFPSMECILVDDASTDNSVAVAERAGLPLRVIRLGRHRGAATARNTGARASSGDILVFIDADVCVHGDTLALIASNFENDSGLAAVFGAYDDNPSEPGFHSQYRNLLHCYVHSTSSSKASTFWTGCGAVRRERFFENGGFDETPGSVDDIEFGRRLDSAGMRIELRPEIRVQHVKRWTFLSTVKTDICLRGVPWTQVILRERRMPNTLNLAYRYRASIVLVWLALAAAILSIAAPASRPILLPAALASLALVLWLNQKLYVFFRECRGIAFAVQSAAAHLLHLFNCGLSFLIGTVLFALGMTSHAPTAPARAGLKVADD